MGIITYIILGIVLGLLCYLAVRFIPMPDPWPRAIPIMAVVLWVLLGLIAVFGGVTDYPMPKLR